MSVEVREVSCKRDLQHFIYLPEKIHQNHQNWVHPLYMDEWPFFNKRKNKSFSLCDTIMALAWKDKQPVGRIMGIINEEYNEIHNEKNARFCFLDCYEDITIAQSLVIFIEEWAGKKGMVKLVGPLAFSDKDPQGVLTAGFDEPVLIAMNYNYPWIQDYLAQLGFMKEVDLVSYKVNIPDTVPEYIQKVYNRVITSNGYILHEFTSRKSLKPWIVPIFRLINETYNHIYGFIPMTEQEMHEMASRYLPVLNPRFIKVISNPENEVFAFVISMPELSGGIRKAKGRIMPFGWYHILAESKKTRLLTMLLGAIKESQRGKGLDSILGMKILESAHQTGMKVMDSHLILEYNTRMRAEYERIGGTINRRFRVFGKVLRGFN